MTDSTSSAFSEACRLAEMGFRVFPSGDNWTKAAMAHATRDLKILNALREIDPAADWRVRLGREEGLVVLLTQSMSDYNGLVQQLGPLPRSWRSKRRSARTLRWFSIDANAPDLKLGTPLLGTRARLSRSAAIPNSKHESGDRYEWHLSPGELPLAPLPESWVNGLPAKINSRPVEVVERWEWTPDKPPADWSPHSWTDPLADW